MIGQTGKTMRPWRDDPDILWRINILGQLCVQGHNCNAQFAGVNMALQQKGRPPISWPTFWRDKRRNTALWRETAIDNTNDVEASLRAVKTSAWEAFHNTSNASLNRSAYLNTIVRCEELLAKMRGDVGNTITVRGDAAAPIRVVTDVTLTMSEEDLAETLRHTLEFVPSARRLLMGPDKLIDMPPPVNGHSPPPSNGNGHGVVDDLSIDGFNLQ